MNNPHSDGSVLAPPSPANLSNTMLTSKVSELACVCVGLGMAPPEFSFIGNRQVTAERSLSFEVASQHLTCLPVWGRGVFFLLVQASPRYWPLSLCSVRVSWCVRWNCPMGWWSTVHSANQKMMPRRKLPFLPSKDWYKTHLSFTFMLEKQHILFVLYTSAVTVSLFVSSSSFFICRIQWDQASLSHLLSSQEWIRYDHHP